MTFKTFCSFQFESTNNFKENLHRLKKLLLNTPEESISVAPEVCFTNFAYDRFEEAAKFSKDVLNEILPLTKNRLFAFTIIEKIGKKFYNVAKVFYNQKIIYSQPKVKLFKFGGETKYFEPGNLKDIKLFEIDGLKIGLLICFELRFIEVWQKLRGADIILIPAMWGKLRKSHFEKLTDALALMNQCFVIASDSSNKDMAKSSAIVDPFGNAYRDDRKKLLLKECNLNKIKKMRKYMDIGL